MFKRTDIAGDWYIYDTARNPYNPVYWETYPHSTAAETNGGNTIDILSNGFRLTTGSQAPKNASGGSFIFAAFGDNPFKYTNAF
jgi:hypothetical protein